MDSSFDWDGYSNTFGNSPAVRMRIPFFSKYEWKPFFAITHKIDSGEFEGKKLDWGCWGAKVNKSQIIEFLEECYKDTSYQQNNKSPMETDEYLNFIDKLNDTQLYILVAREE
jgi:hypothetical protein